MNDKNRITYQKQLIEILGTYHIAFETSPIEALNLPIMLVKDLVDWKTAYIEEMNEKMQEKMKEQQYRIR